MRSRTTCWVTTVVASMGLLLLAETAHTTEHWLRAMQLTKLPGGPAPALTLVDVHGRQVSLQDYRGKVVFLNFWATWCVPCREEMPALEELHQTFHPQGLVILAVNFREGLEPIKAFVVQRQLSFPILLDPSGAVFRAYTAIGLPTAYLISREGRLLAHSVGSRDWRRVEGKDLIRALLTGGSPGFSRDKIGQGGD